PGLNPLQYCRLEDSFYENVAANLRRKYALLNGLVNHECMRIDTKGCHAERGEESHEAKSESRISNLVTNPKTQLPNRQFTTSFDPDYVARKQRRIHKLIRYKNTDNIGYQCPSTANGAP